MVGMGLLLSAATSTAQTISLSTGQSLSSANGQYELTMQQDGNLVLYKNAPFQVALWSSETQGNSGSSATMQADGNFVVYDNAGNPLWDAGTYGNPGATIQVQDNGQLAIQSSTGSILWQVSPVILHIGESLVSPNQQHRLTMASDGSLKLRKTLSTQGFEGEIWASDSRGSNGQFAVMQDDGDFVIYTAAGVAVWSTGTSGHNKSKIELDDNAELRIRDPKDCILWSAETTVLKIGEDIQSDNNAYKLQMAADGTLRVYDIAAQTAIWTSANTSPATMAIMQTDGNFVLYTDTGSPIWATGTNGHIGAELKLNNDGSLTITSFSNIVFSSTYSAQSHFAAPAGPIWGHNDAQTKCAQACSYTWDNQWVTKVANTQSLCSGTNGLGYATEGGISIGFLADDAEAAIQCPKVFNQAVNWSGHWWTTIPGQMSVCICSGVQVPWEPNINVAGCGNGIVEQNEVCDDGNTIPGDGCSNTCDAEIVNFDYYEFTSIQALPDFSTLTPVNSGATHNFDLTQRSVNDNFAFRFTTYLEIPTDGTYTFYTTSDDGSQLFIDGALVVDNDGIQAPTEAYGTISLTAGTYPLEVTYFEAGGGELLSVSWQGPGITKAIIPTSAFRDSIVNTPAPPAPVCGNSTVESGETCDDGNTTSNDGCSSTCQDELVSYYYHEFTSITMLPDFLSLTPAASGLTSNFDISLRTKEDNYGFRFTARLHIPAAGLWTFYTTSDDGSRLYINGSTVVDNDGTHGAQEANGTLTLSEGQHDIEVEFFEHNDAEILEVRWEGPGVTKTLIPSSAFR